MWSSSSARIFSNRFADVASPFSRHMMMPGRSGSDVLRELRADPATAKTPVIMLTARAQASDREAMNLAGADHYLTKPFSPIGLASLVEEVLDS